MDDFLSNNVNGFVGSVLICDTYVVRLYPAIVADLAQGNRVFEYAPESTHIDQFGFKLSTILRLRRVTSLTILTKDGSPHSVQIPLIAQEAAQNVGFPLSSLHCMVMEKDLLVPVSGAAVRSARHLSEIESLLVNHHRAGVHEMLGPTVVQEEPRRPAVAVLVGGRSDVDTLKKSRLLGMLRTMDIRYTVSVISSEQNPEELRNYCLQVLADNVAVCVCIAGLVPGLPAAVKAHLPALPVIAVPISGPGFDAKDIMLASFSLPSRRPVMLAGIDEAGMNKAGHLVCELIGVGSPAFRKAYAEYLHAATPKPDYEIEVSDEREPVRELNTSIELHRNGTSKGH